MLKERQRYQESANRAGALSAGAGSSGGGGDGGPGPGMSALPLFSMYDRFALIRAEAAYSLILELQCPIDIVLAQVT